MFRRRASSTTPRARVPAMAACTSPNVISELKNAFSTQHLRCGSALCDTSCFNQERVVTQPPCLLAIMCDHDARESLFAHQISDQLLDPQLRLFIKCRS